MLAIVTTNLLRRPARTIFTAGGIAVGVATIVALLSFTQGLRSTAAGLRSSRRLGPRRLPGERLRSDRLDPAGLDRRPAGRAPRRGARHAPAADRRSRQGATPPRWCSAPTPAASSPGAWSSSPAAARSPDGRDPRRRPPRATLHLPPGGSPRRQGTPLPDRRHLSLRASSSRTQGRCSGSPKLER